MNILLDTHVIIWSVAEPARIPENALKEIENKVNDIWFSPISIWEILLLAEKKRINLKPDPEKGIRYILRQSPLK